MSFQLTSVDLNSAGQCTQLTMSFVQFSDHCSVQLSGSSFVQFSVGFLFRSIYCGFFVQFSLCSFVQLVKCGFLCSALIHFQFFCSAYFNFGCFVLFISVWVLLFCLIQCGFFCSA